MAPLIDPALEAMLKARGQTDKINELKQASSQASVSKQIIPATKQIISSVKQGAIKVADVVASNPIAPFNNLANALGASLAVPLINRQQDELNKSSQIISKQGLLQLQNPKTTKENKIRISNALNKMDSTSQIANEIPEMKISTKDIWSDAAGLMLLAASNARLGAGRTFGFQTPKMAKFEQGVSKVLSETNQASRIAKLGVAGKYLNAVEKLAIPSAKGTALGTALFLTNEIRQKPIEVDPMLIKELDKRGQLDKIKISQDPGLSEALNSSLGKAAALEAVMGVAGLVLRGLFIGAKYSGKSLNVAGKSAYDYLDAFAKGKVEVNGDIDNIISQAYKQPQNILQKGAEKIVNTADKTKEFFSKANWIDRLSPLEKSQRGLQEDLLKKGQTLEDENKFWQIARGTTSKAKVQVEDAKKEFGKIIQKYSGVEKELKNRQVIMDAIERERKFQNQLNPWKANLDQLEKMKAEHIASATSKGIESTIQDGLTEYNDFNQKLLKYRLDNGLISKESYGKMISENPNYIPHNVIIEDLDNSFAKSGSLNVAKSDIQKAKGSTRQFEDPWQSIVDRIDNVYKLGENNKVGKSIADAHQKYNLGEGFRKVNTAEDIATRNSLYTKWKNVNDTAKKAVNEVGNFFSQQAKSVKQKTQSALMSNKYNLGKGEVRLSSINKAYNKVSDELEKTFEEARVKSAEWDTMSNINKLFNKAESLDKKLLIKSEEVKAKQAIVDNLKNASVEAVTKAKNDLASIKLKYNTVLEGISNSKKEIVNSIKKELEAIKVQPPQIGEETINFLNKGVKETWVVPKDMAVAVKNMNAETMNGVLKFYGKINNVFKMFTTQLSPAFTAQNIARDRQTYINTVDTFINEMAKYAKLDPKEIALSKDELYDLWRRSGGGGSSILSESGISADKQINYLRKQGLISTISDKLNPAKMIEKVNQSAEESTRLMAFKRALEKGLSPTDAATISRDVTVDFSKMGNYMKNLNQVIPFLNARVQGSVNMLKTIKNDPEKFLRTNMLTAVYPTVALYQHNRQFESDKYVSTNIKDNYWYIITGETPATTEDGTEIKVPHIITIKKGEFQQLLSNPVLYTLNRMDNKDFRSTGRFLTDLAGSVSPINYSNFNDQSFLGATLSQLGPVPSILSGLWSGINPQTGFPIVPQSKQATSPYLQSKQTTPDILKEVGNIFTKKNENGVVTGGISPAKLEFVINSSGTVPKDLLKFLNVGENLAKGKPYAKNALTESMSSKIANTPVISSFFREAGEFGSPEQQYNQQVKQKITEEVANRKQLNKDKAEEIFYSYNKLKSPTEKNDYAKMIKATQPPEVFSAVKALVQAKKVSDVIDSNTPVEVRAAVIWERYNRMKNDGSPKEEIDAWIEKLTTAKLLTKETKTAINNLRTSYNYLLKVRLANNRDEQKQAIIEGVKAVRENGGKTGDFATMLQNEGLLDQQMLEEVKKEINKK